jgi:hypothetical protein
MKSIFTDYLKAVKTGGKKYRYDVSETTDSHDYLSRILINKRNPNIDGESFNLVPRPRTFKGTDFSDKAITKGSQNITSVYVPDIGQAIAFGDIIGTNDAVIIRFNNDTENGITTIELFIARGQKHNKRNLYFLFVDGEFTDEMEYLIKKGVAKMVTN